MGLPVDVYGFLFTISSYTLEPNDPSNSSSPRRTYTLRSTTPSTTTKIAATESAPATTASPAESVLATVLDEADIIFSNAGFRYRVKTLDDDNDDEDTMMKDTDIGVGDMSDVRRVLRWRYAFDPADAHPKSNALAAAKAVQNPLPIGLDPSVTVR